MDREKGKEGQRSRERPRKASKDTASPAGIDRISPKMSVTLKMLLGCKVWKQQGSITNKVVFNSTGPSLKNSI